MLRIEHFLMNSSGSDFLAIAVTDFCISSAYFATHRETIENKDGMPYDKPVKAGRSRHKAAGEQSAIKI